MCGSGARVYLHQRGVVWFLRVYGIKQRPGSALHGFIGAIIQAIHIKQALAQV